MSNNLKTYKSLNLGGDGHHDLHVTAFVGGKYGYSVQFTIGYNYCALAENQVRDLISILEKRVRSVYKYKATSDNLDEYLAPVEKD